jgi:molecular chaperone GrpE (heat shock protein)
MNEDQEVQEQSNDNEAGAAEAAPEQDRLGELVRELEEVRQHVLYAQAETQNVRAGSSRRSRRRPLMRRPALPATCCR